MYKEDALLIISTFIVLISFLSYLIIPHARIELKAYSWKTMRITLYIYEGEKPNG